MSANPQGSNAFATNNSGGGVGLRTAMPSTFGNVSQMAQPGQYTPYQTPDWINSGLEQSSMPISNYPVQNYGRWNWNNGNYNGQGMSAGGWPSPQSITQPYGPPQSQVSMPQQNGPGTNMQTQQQQFPSSQGFPPGVMPSQQQQPQPGPGMANLASRGFDANAGTWAPGTGRGAGQGPHDMGINQHNPAQTQAWNQQYQGLSPDQQASFLTQNAPARMALGRKGLISNQQINDALYSPGSASPYPFYGQGTAPPGFANPLPPGRRR